MDSSDDQRYCQKNLSVIIKNMKTFLICNCKCKLEDLTSNLPNYQYNSLKEIRECEKVSDKDGRLEEILKYIIKNEFDVSNVPMCDNIHGNK